MYHTPTKEGYILNKYFIDQTFTDPCTIYDYTVPEDIKWPTSY
jgi:hypothetical protein